MNLDEFLWHAKRGHGDCILEMKQGNIVNYLEIVKKVFLNNYAFLHDDEYRSSYAYELVSFYKDDRYFLNLLWNKIKRTKLEDYYNFDYLLNNMYFLLKNTDYNYEKKIKSFFVKKLNKSFFSTNENNSICSLISLILDLDLNICVKKIINQYCNKYENLNLDLSNIEYFYRLNLISKNKKLQNEEIYKDNNMLIECISNNDYFNKQLPFIANYIDNEKIDFLLELLEDDNFDEVFKNNILKIILYSEKRNAKILNKLIKIMDSLNNNQKNIIYDILSKTKSKKILTILYKKKTKNSFIIRLLLNNYCKENYDKIHNGILKLRINYSNEDNWFEVESELIKCCTKNDFDKRLLADLKFFLKNGLSSASRYKIITILKKYNMLDENEIESLKFDANYKIRQNFKKL